MPADDVPQVPLYIALAQDTNCFVRSETGLALKHLATLIPPDAMLHLLPAMYAMYDDSSRWVCSLSP